MYKDPQSHWLTPQQIAEMGFNSPAPDHKDIPAQEAISRRMDLYADWLIDKLKQDLPSSASLSVIAIVDNEVMEPGARKMLNPEMLAHMVRHGFLSAPERQAETGTWAQDIARENGRSGTRGRSV